LSPSISPVDRASAALEIDVSLVTGGSGISIPQVDRQVLAVGVGSTSEKRELFRISAQCVIR
jgi:hypothetical protein